MALSVVQFASAFSSLGNGASLSVTFGSATTPGSMLLGITLYIAGFHPNPAPGSFSILDFDGAHYLVYEIVSSGATSYTIATTDSGSGSGSYLGCLWEISGFQAFSPTSGTTEGLNNLGDTLGSAGGSTGMTINETASSNNDGNLLLFAALENTQALSSAPPGLTPDLNSGNNNWAGHLAAIAAGVIESPTISYASNSSTLLGATVMVWDGGFRKIPYQPQYQRAPLLAL